VVLLVNPIHFEDFGGRQFERLVFTYVLRTDRWRTIEWYGQRDRILNSIFGA